MCQAPCCPWDIMAKGPQSLTSGGFEADGRRSNELHPSVPPWNRANPSSPQTTSPWRTDSKLDVPSQGGLQKMALTPKAKIPETALFQQNCLPQRPLLLLCSDFPFSKEPKGRQTSARDLCQPLPRQGSGQRSHKHLGERMDLAVWDVPAVPTLWCPVEGLEKYRQMATIPPHLPESQGGVGIPKWAKGFHKKLKPARSCIIRLPWNTF